MAQPVLILYSTVDCHTLHICERISHVIQELGCETAIVSVDDANDLDLTGFSRVVIGASIRYGHHRPEVAAFIAKHQAELESRPSAFFCVNVVARKPNKNTPQTNPYARKFLRSIAWKPQLAAVFAGKIDYPRYGFIDRQMIRFIMLVTHGPTDPNTVVEFTDWAQVETFALAVCALPNHESRPYMGEPFAPSTLSAPFL
jgi:menaquinone-dependent protoporphyrinogen oxidase